MKYTESIGLKKYEQSDPADLTVTSENMDILDSEIKDIKSSLSNLENLKDEVDSLDSDTKELEKQVKRKVSHDEFETVHNDSHDLGNANMKVGNGLSEITTGGSNTAVGDGALIADDSGTHNTACGARALYNNTEGQFNAALSVNALFLNTTGNYNTAAGAMALYGQTAGIRNTGVGLQALYSNTTGSNNTALGVDAGRYTSKENNLGENTVADNSVFIGAWTRPNDKNESNQIVIGYDAKGQGNNTAHIGNAAVTAISFGPGTSSAFTTNSDARIKEDIIDADTAICYEDIKNLSLRRFKYKDFIGNQGDRHLLGFLSEDFKEILPKAVNQTDMSFDQRDSEGRVIYETKLVEETDPDTREKKTRKIEAPKQVVIKGCESIDTSQLVPMLVGAVQELMFRVEELESRLQQ